MRSSVSLSELQDRGVTLRPHEAVAIAQMLMLHPEASEASARPPYGPPSRETVHVKSDGSVVCSRSAATPAVSEIAILLHELLPPEKMRVPGGLRYAIGRALLEVEAPPFDSVVDFSHALERYEQGEREDVLRMLVERFETAPDSGSREWPPLKIARQGPNGPWSSSVPGRV